METTDLYRHDEEQAYITLMSQEVKSLNFAAEENYTIRLCVRTRPPGLPTLACTQSVSPACGPETVCS